MTYGTIEGVLGEKIERWANNLLQIQNFKQTATG
jgi:hypothetical protein